MKNHVIIIKPLIASESETMYLPLGPLYLAESLLAAGYEVSILEDNVKNTLRKTHQLLSKDTICISISTMSGPQLANAVTIAKELKTKYQIPLIWGGVHITSLPEQSLKSDLVDYIVWGEGENALVSLVGAIKNNEIPRDIPGVGYKEKGGVTLHIGKNSGYTSLGRMFKLPYQMLDMNRYARRLMIGAKREFSIWTSRGCPFRCRFCSNSSSSWPNTKVRYHTMEHIIDDVKTLVSKYGADMINFSDECFLLNEKSFLDILRAIRKEGIFIKYRFAARADLLIRLKEETWKALKEYGVAAIAMAPESGSERILNYMGKRITVEQIHKVDAILTKYNFYKTYNMLICTPREKREDLKLTLRLISDLAKTSMRSPYPFGTLHKYIPLPSTELYEDAIKCGFLPPQSLEEWGEVDLFCDWDRFNAKNVIRPWVSPSDVGYIEKATFLVEKLNREFKGPKSNKESIREIMKEIEDLIKE